MIGVRGLQFTYQGKEHPAVDDLTFHVEKGEVFGFLGPSGAGKSTTQKILIRLLQGYRGDVNVLNRNLSDWNSDYYERVGVAFEFPNHYLKLTAAENLRYFGSLYSRVAHSPEALLDLVDLLPDAGTPVAQFSKGMKGRLSVARALIHDPDLLFLDEPTAGLDPVNARRMKELIRTRKDAGTTIFLTTHDMTVADDLCDRVAFLVDGRIRLIDSPRQLKLQHGTPRVRVEYLEENHTRRQEFPLAGLSENQEFLSVLRNHTAQTIHTLEATLEDIFILATGRSLS